MSRYQSIACCIVFVSYVFVALAQTKSTALPTQVKNESLLNRMDRLIQELDENQTKKFNELESKVTQLNIKVKQLETYVESLLQNGIQFKTCAEMLKSNPFLKSGMFWIDPDGHDVGDDPILVYCDMTDGTTSIPHDLKENTSVSKCTSPGCYSVPITYSNATFQQIKALADASLECHQSIRYDCQQAPFMKKSITYSWWNDRNGRNQSFWSGDGLTNITCQCGIRENCFVELFSCNCDSLASLPLSDFGVVTNKNYLPITRLNFGGMERLTSSGNYTLGKFNCSGIQEFDRVPTSCDDLQRIGHKLSGYYSIKREQSMDMVYCRFTKNLELTDNQERIGEMDIKTPVYFSVKRTRYIMSIDEGQRLTFDEEMVNIGKAMNLRTGVFTAPKDGTYFFIFAGNVEFNRRMELLITLTGLQTNSSARFIGDELSAASTSLHATGYLKSDSQVYLILNYVLTKPHGAKLIDYYGEKYLTHFSGWLLKEDI